MIPANLEIQHGVLNRKPRSLWTIHQCFIVLGAKRTDIYVGRENWNKDYRSIYNRYEKWELEYMARELWKESIKKYHPDRAPEDVRESYEHMTAEVNAAHDRIGYILSHK